MLSFCKTCRNTTDIKIKVHDHKAKKLDGDAICVQCGDPVVISSFTKTEMIRKRDFITQAEAKTMAVRCHACDMNVESKLDAQSKPRCMRCGTRLNLTIMMVRAMKEDMKLYMSAEELDKFKIAK